MQEMVLTPTGFLVETSTTVGALSVEKAGIFDALDAADRAPSYCTECARQAHVRLDQIFEALAGRDVAYLPPDLPVTVSEWWGVDPHDCGDFV